MPFPLLPCAVGRCPCVINFSTRLEFLLILHLLPLSLLLITYYYSILFMYTIYLVNTFTDLLIFHQPLLGHEHTNTRGTRCIKINRMAINRKYTIINRFLPNQVSPLPHCVVAQPVQRVPYRFGRIAGFPSATARETKLYIYIYIYLSICSDDERPRPRTRFQLGGCISSIIIIIISTCALGPCAMALTVTVT